MASGVRCSLGQGQLEAARPLLALGSQNCSFPQVKLWRLPAPGQELPSGPGLVLGPEDTQVEVLQFHPTVDGVLVSVAGTAVKVWDAARQQPLTGIGPTGCIAGRAAPSRTVLHFFVYVFDNLSCKVCIKISRICSIKLCCYKYPTLSTFRRHLFSFFFCFFLYVSK